MQRCVANILALVATFTTASAHAQGRSQDHRPADAAPPAAAQSGDVARQAAIDRARELANRNVGVSPADIPGASTSTGNGGHGSAAMQSALDRARELADRNVGVRPADVPRASTATVGHGRRAPLQSALDRARAVAGLRSGRDVGEIGRGLNHHPDSVLPSAQAPPSIDRQIGSTIRPMTAREETNRRRMSAIEAMRDRAIETGNVQLLQRADELEQRLQPSAADQAMTQPQRFEPGLGRETARHARGIDADQMPDSYWADFDAGAPGFGRRTSEVRRAGYDANPVDEPSTSTTPSPTTDPSVTDPSLGGAPSSDLTSTLNPPATFDVPEQPQRLPPLSDAEAENSPAAPTEDSTIKPTN